MRVSGPGPSEKRKGHRRPKPPVTMTPWVNSVIAQCSVVTGAEGTEDAPKPLRFLAFTVHVYVFPELRLSTLIDDERRLSERARPPLLEVHVARYSKIEDPPLLAGGENETVMLW